MKYIIFALIIWSVAVFAEIEQVTISWTPGLCLTQCEKVMQQQLSAIPSVEEIKINQPAGRAYIKLKPGTAFSFAPYNTAMRLIGLSIQEIRVTVTGQILSQGSNYVIKSSGDNTTFILVNPIVPSR